MESLVVVTVLLNIALTIFWIYMAIQAVNALRQIAATLRRLAVSQERIMQSLSGAAPFQK